MVRIAPTAALLFAAILNYALDAGPLWVFGLGVAGITALAIVAIALFAVFSASGGGETANFTPNDEGLIPAGERAPSFTADTVSGAVAPGKGSRPDGSSRKRLPS